jgi:hypothetical protein
MIDPGDIEKIRRLISSDNLKAALDELVEKADRKAEYYDSIVSISARYNNLESKFSKNLISNEDHNRELNQLRKYVLDSLRDIEDLTEEKVEKETEGTQTNAEVSKDIPTRIIEAISRDHLDEALEFLKIWIKENYEDSEYENEYSFLLSQYSRLQQEIQLGTISSDSYRVELEKLKNILLEFINKVRSIPKREKEQKEKQEQIEKSAASFVEESIDALNKRERILKIQAITWYLIGFVALISGVFVAVYYINFNTIDTDSVVKIIYQIFKSIFVIGLLVAASRYAFNLGKTYMNEALKNADRIHAISFGKFYLQVFGTDIKSDDLKEVFKDWNTNQESPFVRLDSSEFDPKMLEAFSKFVEAMKSK